MPSASVSLPVLSRDAHGRFDVRALGAVRAMGKPMEDLVKQKIVVVGAGRYTVRKRKRRFLFCPSSFWNTVLITLVFQCNLFKCSPVSACFIICCVCYFIYFVCSLCSAGLGVVNMVKSAMQRLLGGHTKETHKKAIDQFWILDKDVRVWHCYFFAESCCSWIA